MHRTCNAERFVQFRLGAPMQDNIATLVPTKSDTEIAAELKNEIIEAYKPVIAVLDKAAALGFVVMVQTQQNMFKKNQIVNLTVAKHF